jgi:hypothetical protein
MAKLQNKIDRAGSNQRPCSLKSTDMPLDPSALACVTGFALQYVLRCVLCVLTY